MIVIEHNGDGTARALAVMGNPITELGTAKSTRASHIRPVHFIKAIAFRSLRLFLGERGRVAGWTRTWRGPWKVTLIESGETAIFNTRPEAIAWEQARLLL